MRVVLDVSAVPSRPVGVGTYVIALARGIDNRPDIELHLVARRGDGATWRTHVASAHIHDVVPHRRPARLAWEQLATPRLARRLAADVWHAPHYTMPLRLRVPAVVTVHDLTFFDHPEWHERTKVMFFRRMIRAAAAKAAVVCCDSEYTAGRLRELLAPSADVMVAPLGVDQHRFAAASADDIARLAARGIAAPYIAFAGTIEPRKNVPGLVRAFAQVARARPELRLILAGSDGWGTAEARAAISASGAASRVLRPGYLDDATLAALFRHAELVAYPSFEEGFGLPALEALASGTPLVTTKGSALEEVVGDAALLVTPGDDEELAIAIERVLDDVSLAARLRAAGPARAAAFSWDRTVDATIVAYERAAHARA
ncbi:MAG TPA: glycosyltransferase family 1 protein [Acidimicrobiia bacterium]|nr:glycosyltransferase family 1 protein [Acidimicrobiia bacterium]